MANAYSVPQSMGQYIDPINGDLVESVLASKEKKYDYNVAKVDSLIQQYTNMPLARDQDKQYLKDRIDNVLKVVNGVSKLDMSNNNITRQIEQGIGTAIDDRVLEQMGNTKSIMSFEQEVAKKREKGDGTYDDRNYTIAKKRAGVDDYLSGKTDKVGGLHYTDYYDVDKNLTEPLEKWAKELGFTKTIAEDGNEMFIRKETKQVLTPEKIEDYYNTKLQSDPKLQSQMSINSEYEYGGKDDATFKTEYRKAVSDKRGEIEGVIAKIKTATSNLPVGSEESKQVEAVTNNYKNALTIFDNQLKEIDNNNYNRSSVQTEIYSNKLLNNYKKTYAKSETLSVDYDDTPMKIQEFEWKKAEAIRKSAEAKNEASGLNPDGTGVGTTYTPKSAGELEQEKPDLFTVAGTNFSKSYRAFDSYLAATNKDYAKGDAATRKTIRDQITINMGKESLTAKNMPQEGKDLAEAYIQNSQIYTKVNKEINSNIDGEIIKIYNGMTTEKGNINLSVLGRNMPETAKAITSGRSYKDLTKEQRYAVKMEMSNNLKTTVAKGNSIKYLDSYNKNLQKESGIKFKEPVVSDIAGGSWETLKAFSGQILGLGKGILLGLSPFHDSEEKAKGFGELKKDYDVYSTNLGKGLEMMGKSTSGVFTNDEDLNSIGSSEVGLKSGENVSDRWSTTSDYIETLVGLRLKDLSEPMSNISGISYNPSVKNELPITKSLQSIILSEGVTPTKDTAYRVEFNPDGKTAKIIVNAQMLSNNDKGKQIKVVGENTEITVDASRLPKSIVNNVSTQKANWTYNYNNPSNFSKTYTFDVIPTEKDKEDYLDNLDNNNPGVISPESMHDIRTSKNSPIKTAQEYKEIVDNLQRSYNLTPDDVSKMNSSIVNAKYEINYKKTVGVGFYGIISNGVDAPLKFDMKGENFNPTKASMNSMLYVNNIILSKLNEYATKNAKR